MEKGKSQRDEARPSFPNSKLLALNVLLIVSVVLNVLLAYRLKRQDSQLISKRSENMLPIGTVVPAILATEWDDNSRREISFETSSYPTVLYVFTPSCSWCKRNTDNLNALVSQKSKEYRFIGLSLSRNGLADYIATQQLNVPVYVDPAKEILATYKLGGTPQTIVISPRGAVLRNWQGAYTGAQQQEVEAFFNFKLPGLRAESQ